MTLGIERFRRARPIVYVTAIEDIARSPLIRSQVLTLLRALAAEQFGRPVALVSLYPLGNWLRFRRIVAELRAELAQQGIAFHVWPLLFLTRFFYIPRWLLPLYWLQAFLAALWIGRRLRPALVHCRSYPATMVGRLVKRFGSARLVFDTRALYPEEGATLAEGGKSVLLDQASFAAWKRIEDGLVEAADAVAVVSAASAAILAQQYPAAGARLVVVPTCSRLPAEEELALWRQQTRQELGLANQVVVAYAGSWFEPVPAVKLFKRLVRAMPAAEWYFVLLVSARAAGSSRSGADGLEAMVRRELGPNVDCTAIGAPQSKVLRYLAGADLAAQPVGISALAQEDPRYALTARTRLSVKFTEYLAAGLPVVVSQWAGAAAEIAETHDLGLVYDRTSDEEMARWLTEWLNRRADYRTRAWQFARDQFSTEVVTGKYLALYARLLGSQR